MVFMPMYFFLAKHRTFMIFSSSMLTGKAPLASLAIPPVIPKAISHPVYKALLRRTLFTSLTKLSDAWISASRPSENRYGKNLEHLQAGAATQAGPSREGELRYPFPLLSDILDYEVHRRYGAFDARTGRPVEAVFVVDRAGVIRNTHLGPGGLGDAGEWVRELQEVR